MAWRGPVQSGLRDCDSSRASKNRRHGDSKFRVRQASTNKQVHHTALPYLEMATIFVSIPDTMSTLKQNGLASHQVQRRGPLLLFQRPKIVNA
eukprot:1146011-Pelagomonas_calceolata.AAC.2